MENLTTVTPYIHRITIPYKDIYTSVFIIQTDCGTVLFDTATLPEEMDAYVLPALDALGIPHDQLTCVVISHNHRDHGGGLARICQLFPGITVAAGSDLCGERIPGYPVRVVTDGETLLGPLTIVSIPGHTADSIGVLDTRTKTLLPGDSLQLYGIYGSGDWGSNISYAPEHLAAVARLKQKDIENIFAAHDYHPCGNCAQGRDAVAQYIDACEEALMRLKEYILRYPELDDQALAAQFNATANLPTLQVKVFRLLREAMSKGLV